MDYKERFKVPIPDGYRVFEKEFSIAGSQHYKQNYQKVFKKGDLEIGMDPEAENKFDPNAIAVVATARGFFGSKKSVTLGYIPGEIAATIADSKVLHSLLFRTKSIFITPSGFIEMKADLLGPKDRYEAYSQV